MCLTFIDFIFALKHSFGSLAVLAVLYVHFRHSTHNEHNVNGNICELFHVLLVHYQNIIVSRWCTFLSNFLETDGNIIIFVCLKCCFRFLVIKLFCSNMLNNGCANNNFDEIRKLHLEYKAQRSIWFRQHEQITNITTVITLKHLPVPVASTSASLSLSLWCPNPKNHTTDILSSVRLCVRHAMKKSRDMVGIRNFAIYYMCFQQI